MSYHRSLEPKEISTQHRNITYLPIFPMQSISWVSSFNFNFTSRFAISPGISAIFTPVIFIGPGRLVDYLREIILNSENNNSRIQKFKFEYLKIRKFRFKNLKTQTFKNSIIQKLKKSKTKIEKFKN